MFDQQLWSRMKWLQLIPAFKEINWIVILKKDGELKAVITNWFKKVVANFYEDGIKKLLKKYLKSVQVNGDYVHKKEDLFSCNINNFIF